MPQFIAYAVAYAATAISATVGGWVATITGSLALGGSVSTAVYYASSLVIYAGLAEALQPKVPKPETGVVPIKQSRPSRRRGYGRYRTAGPWVLWEAKDNKAIDVMALHDGEIDGFEQVYLHDDAVTLVGDVVQSGPDGRYWSPDQRVRMWFRTGQTPETPYAEIIAALPSKWTTAHRGDGVASLAMICTHGKLEHFQHDFPNGEPQPSVVIRAQRVYDPRDEAQSPSDRSTWTWSENFALCLLHYLAYDRGYAYDWAPDETCTFNSVKWERRFGRTLAYWRHAADVCDAGGYVGGGGFDAANNDEQSIVNLFLTGMDGWLSFDARGGFIVYAGEYYSPSVTLTNAHIRGFVVQDGVEAENRVNRIVPSYTEPAERYAEKEADPWDDEAAIAAMGVIRPESLSLPWVQSYELARKLAKRRMTRHAAIWRVTLSVNLGAIAMMGERFIRVSAPEELHPALDGVVYEVISSPKIDLMAGTITFDAVSADEARDDWDPDTEAGEPPPIPDEPELEELAAPVIDFVTPWWVDASAANVRATVHVTGPDREDLTWFVQVREQAFTLYGPAENPDDGGVHPSPALQIGPQPVGKLYDVQVRYQTGGGQVSEWSAIGLLDTNFPAIPWTADSAVVTADSLFFTADGGHA